MSEQPIEEIIGWHKGGLRWTPLDGTWHVRAEADDLAAWLKAETGAPYLSIEQPAYDPETWERDWDSTDYHVTLWGEGYAEQPIPIGRGATPRAALEAAVRKVAAQ